MRYSLSQAEAARRAALERGSLRRQYRHKILPLAYMTVDEENHGILCDISAAGAAIHAVRAVQQDQRVRLRFHLPNSRLAVDLHARVQWANAYGQAGLHFLEPDPQLQVRLNAWIFRDLLSRLAQQESIWESQERSQVELVLSPNARPAITLAIPSSPLPEVLPALSSNALKTRADVSVISQHLAELMDGLVLCCAVLLFLVIFLAVAHGMPSWPLAGIATAGVTFFFALLYWGVFARFGGGTAGTRLARIGLKDSENGATLREGEERFR
jgi:hypothetical protein